jgi:hypothetical protein
MAENKPCNCGKNSSGKLLFNRKPVEKIELPTREEPMTIPNPFNMIQSYAMSLISKGFTNKKVEKETKQLRVLSCFGNGGSIPPCEHLSKSTTEGKFFCGGCGCGDRKQTWLNGSDDEYSKLDFPKLNCPLKMPGFTNYIPCTISETNNPDNRKNKIEKLSIEDVENVVITTPDAPEELQKIFDKIIEAEEKRKIEKE